MKYANKLMVVPYVPRINDNPKEKQILSIDQDMEEILKDKTISADQKVRLYNQALLKYNDNLSRYNLSNASEKDQSDNIFTDKLASKIGEKLPQLVNIKQEIKNENKEPNTPIKSEVKNKQEVSNDEQENIKDEKLQPIYQFFKRSDTQITQPSSDKRNTN